MAACSPKCLANLLDAVLMCVLTMDHAATVLSKGSTKDVSEKHINGRVVTA